MRVQLRRVAFVGNNKSVFNDDFRPYIGLEHIASWTGEISDSDCAQPEGLVAHFDSGDILFGKLRPYLAKVAAPNFRGVCSTEALVIKPSKQVASRFLRYSLAAPSFIDRVNAATYGAKMPRASWENIGTETIWLPDLATQRQIADFLDRETARIDLLIEKKQRLVDVIKTKLDGKIFGLITSGVENAAIDGNVDLGWHRGVPERWQVRKVKHLFRLVTDPAPKNNNYELLSVYTAIGVRPRKDLEERGNKASTTDGYWRVRKGDIVVNKLLAWMGAIGVSEYSGVTSPAYDILRPTSRLEPHYYHYLFRIPRFSQELKRHSRGIMEMRLRLYFENFGRILVPVPPIEEQRAIVSALRSEDTKHGILSKRISLSIDLLKEYRSAMITAAVTGQIDVATYAKSGTADRQLDAIQEEMEA